jgi:hypothetical protein
VLLSERVERCADMREPCRRALQRRCRSRYIGKSTHDLRPSRESGQHLESREEEKVVEGTTAARG